MTVATLPAPVTKVTLPKYLSPSRFGDLGRCPLKVFATADSVPGTLPPSPRSLFGIMLHHVREQLLLGRWGAADNGGEACSELLASATEQMDSMLLSDPRTAGLAPLSATVGRTRWNSRVFEMRRWAERLDAMPTGEAPAELETSMNLAGREGERREDRDAARVDVGPEAWVVCPPLRLRGRADHIKEAADGAFEISDFKSGATLDDEEKPLTHHALQVGLYALAVENVIDVEVRLYMEGSDRVRVPWTEEARQECVETLRAAMEEFPAGEDRAAEELARPGWWCRGCRLRPTCPNYLADVPKWWHNGGDVPRPLPWDSWGTITDIQVHDAVAKIEIVDAAGRSVRIEGIDTAREVADLNVGDEIFLFDLMPTEPTIHHGARLQPRNFHELPPDGGLRLRRARSLQLYRAS